MTWQKHKKKILLLLDVVERLALEESLENQIYKSIIRVRLNLAYLVRN